MNSINPFAIIGSIISAILPAAVVAAIDAWLDKARGLLQGETLRAIGYGAGLVIYLVAKASGSIPDLPLDQALLQAGSAAALLVTLIEAARKYVYSPATVAAIVATPPTAAGPVVAAAAAGVDPALIDEAMVAAPPADPDQATALANLDALAAADEG